MGKPVLFNEFDMVQNNFSLELCLKFSLIQISVCSRWSTSVRKNMSDRVARKHPCHLFNFISNPSSASGVVAVPHEILHYQKCSVLAF